MRTTTILALVAAMGLTMSTAAFAQSRNFDLTGFHRIDISTGLDAVVTLGDSFVIKAESRSQDALDNLQVAVTDGVLTARIDSSFLDFIINGGLVGMLFNNGNAVKVSITVPALVGASASSGADIELPEFTSDRLELNASSGSDIEVSGAQVGTVVAISDSGADIRLSGEAQNIEANASSGADIDAEELTAVSAIANASGGANISIHASQRIRADASSGSDIEIHGNPAERDEHASSGGDISYND